MSESDHDLTPAHEIAEGRCNLYLFLSSLFRDVPSVELLRLLSLAEAPSTGLSASQLEELLGADSFASITRAARAALDDEEALGQDFQNLMKVPAGPYLTPYESAYLGDPGPKTRGRGLLMGKPAREVAALYREAGLSLDGPCSEMPDHICVEMDFMSACAAEEAGARRQGDEAEAAGWMRFQHALLRGHLARWAPLLCDTMSRNARTDFYRAVGHLVPGLLQRDLDLLENLLGIDQDKAVESPEEHPGRPGDRPRSASAEDLAPRGGTAGAGKGS